MSVPQPQMPPDPLRLYFVAKWSSGWTEMNGRRDQEGDPVGDRACSVHRHRWLLEAFD